MTTYTSVEQYAEHVLKESASVIDDLCEQVGAQHPAVLTLSSLLCEAVTILQQECMQRERNAPGAYDLTTLPPLALRHSAATLPPETE